MNNACGTNYHYYASHQIHTLKVFGFKRHQSYSIDMEHDVGFVVQKIYQHLHNAICDIWFDFQCAGRTDEAQETGYRIIMHKSATSVAAGFQQLIGGLLMRGHIPDQWREKMLRMHDKLGNVSGMASLIPLLIFADPMPFKYGSISFISQERHFTICIDSDTDGYYFNITASKAVEPTAPPTVCTIRRTVTRISNMDTPVMAEMLEQL